jgi:hypothetical protein
VICEDDDKRLSHSGDYEVNKPRKKPASTQKTEIENSDFTQKKPNNSIPLLRWFLAWLIHRP